MDGMTGPGLQQDAHEASASCAIAPAVLATAAPDEAGGSLAWRLWNALQFAFTLAWTAGWITLALLVRPWSGADAGLPLRMAARCWAPGLLWGAGARLQVEGRERIDFSRPCLFVANHQSVIDICALFRAIPVPLRFLLKQEMKRVPFVGWYACATGMLFIVRDSARAGALFRRQAAALLADGHSLCLFPEGTRSRNGQMAPFKAGSLQSAIDAGVDVVPVALHGAGRVLPVDGFFRVRPGTIRVGFGAPLPTRVDGRPVARQALAEAAQARVQAILDGWE
jgi:1-acyl-sn-glycerol-3-phosphate acyltransferase